MYFRYTYIISLVLYIHCTTPQIDNRVIFVPCAALTKHAGRRMHEESHTQTSDLDNNSRDDIYEEDILEYQFLHK
ncbi:hypothetical protein ALC57_14872 [Trachymyrmex cornetzi]|uniref:Uncharacterized protein n=1 Tax=Trachymyrmex cornetzi TaxID=471704 RepID=A0A195DJ11_9HYME|nr:hypothetical protein ALC57_14872 [Trachymyrmex cornetzi]